MSLRVLLRDQPTRSIALATDTHALIFRYTQSQQNITSTGRGSSPKCMVEFCPVERANLSQYTDVRAQKAFGTLGLINVKGDVFLCVITGSTLVATVRPGEHVQRIVSVEFYCLNRSDFDRSWSAPSGPAGGSRYEYGDPNYYDERHAHDYQDPAGQQPIEHPCLSLRHMLGGGSFYYSVDFDLTNRLQNRITELSAFDVDSLDHSFLWNTYMIEPLIQFRSHLHPADKKALDATCILTSAIRGFVGSYHIAAAADPIKTTSTLPSSLTLISRLSCRRAGTRFNSRGIDDEGNVANFVETETIYYVPDGTCFSYAQVRGSVPIFWEQSAALMPNQQKIMITRSPDATQPAFDKHFEDLELKYGTIHVLNLLSPLKPGEAELIKRYTDHIHSSSLNRRLQQEKTSEHAMLQATNVDYHAEARIQTYEASNVVRDLVREPANNFGFFMSLGLEEQTSILLQQDGVFRTNCLDCLDRTNVVQTMLSQLGLELFFLQQRGRARADYWMHHSTLWADNGDALSKIYAGTGALKSSFTRSGKLSLAGTLADIRKSAQRLYINNFEDETRQNTIDTLLGRLVDQASVQLFDPINDFVTAELVKREREYTRTSEITILTGTFNLNGKGKGLREDLSTWLCPEVKGAEAPDVVAVGFQELVELTANNMVATDPARRQEWERAVDQTLNEVAERNKHDSYVLLRSGQLVGAALMVFVKRSVLPSIKNAEGSIKKTGMSGMAGNKGAVAIRFDFANTRVCFVTAHLAAGFANYEERNRDYHTIAHGLRFQRNRSIDDHDAVLWLGDFNYRIGLANDKVRTLIKARDLPALFRNDQLNLQMVAGHAFPFYREGSIAFDPTYKYDNGTDVYDSSEKARIPAWCDRVLWKGDGLALLTYDTAPLRFSDHRPVYAAFSCVVRVEDDAVKGKLARELYERRRAEVGSSGDIDTDGDIDEDLLGYEAIEPGLAPASSESSKWWLKGGQPARSSIADAHAGYEPNPRRPANPYTPSSEADWVLVNASPPKHSSPQPEFRSRPEPPPPRRPLRKDSGLSQSSTASASTKATPAAPTTQRDAFTESPSQLRPSASPTSSSPSTASRKAAPPVPRKPVALASSSTGDAPPRGTYPGATQQEQQKPPSRASTMSQLPPDAGPNKLSKPAPQPRAPPGVIDTGFPPPPRRRTGTAERGVPGAFPSGQWGGGSSVGSVRSIDSWGSRGGLDGSTEAGPPLPVRRPTDGPAQPPAASSTQPALQPLQRQRKGGPVRDVLPPPDLMDDSSHGAMDIKPLVPGRPR